MTDDQYRRELVKNIRLYDAHIAAARLKGYHTRGLVLARNRNQRLLDRFEVRVAANQSVPA